MPRSLLLALMATAALGLAPGCAAGQREKGNLVALAVSPAALEAAHASRRIALVVGIDRFEDPGWRNLRFAAKDAVDLGGVLADPRRGGYQVLLHTEPAQSTRAALLQAVESLRAVNTSPDDVVLLYFSTHGTLARDATGVMRRYLVAADTRVADVRSGGISLDALQQALEQLPSRRKVLVLAMCHSGAGKSLLPPEVERELEGTKADFFPRPLEEQSRASIVLAACDWGETAREDEALGNDIYTHFLVEALGTAGDRNGDGAVSATEAHDYARRRTYAFTRGQQRPSAQIQEVGADPVILAGHLDRVGLPELYGYELSLDGLGLRVDGDDPVPLPGGRALAAGSHRVQIVKGDGLAVLDTQVNLGLGERVDLSELMARRKGPAIIGAAVGYQGFLDGDASRTVAGPTPAVQLSLGLPELLARHLGLRFDGSTSSGRRELVLPDSGAPVPYQFLSVQLGVAAPYARRLGWLTVDAGPRIGAVYLSRAFALSAFRERQSYLVVSPGLTAGASLPLSERVSLQLRGDLSAQVVAVDGKARPLGQGAVWVGLGFQP
jgi:uncharacterized caspase-like protein